MEFLREGAAIDDFMSSDRIVVGVNNERSKEYFKVLYAPFNRNQDRLISMDPRSAELTKYAANAMLATKISYINELSQLSERLGADIEQVRIGVGFDPRIGTHFINPGCGYGGSCFPKDLSALTQMAKVANLDLALINAVQQVNEQQKKTLFHKMKKYFKGDLKHKTIALWGLSFKPNTDDMREAPSRTLMELLWTEGAKINAHDPVAMPEAKRIYGDRADLKFCRTPEETLENADALAIVTEWPVFSSPDFVRIKQDLKQPVIFDGRNLYDPAYLRGLGFSYYAIGRGDDINAD
jgi:UDPglucose 6-dehydrogenase